MIDHLPNWINILFLLTVVTTLVLFYTANNKPDKLIVFLVIWSIVHSVLAYSGFYHDIESFPPRFGALIIPATVLTIWGLSKKNLTWLEENRDIRLSTFLHTVRIPVEITLLYLFLNGMVPELMTFEGRNFDILAGLTAIIVGLLFLKGKISERLLLGWNMICLCLVLFILVNGLLSAEFAFQQFGFDQPNRAVFYFPFVLLPGLIVPIVVFTHLSDILLLLRRLKEKA